MSDHALFDPYWKRHLNCVIQAQGLLSNPMRTFEKTLTSEYLAIDNSEGVRVVLRDDIRQWAAENTPTISMRATPDFRLIVGSDDEQDFTMFQMRWL